MIKGLKRLEGVKSAELTNFEEGEFKVVLAGTSKVKPSDVRKAVGSFTLRSVHAALPGTVAREKEALQLAASSGATIALKNGESKEDVAAKLDEMIKEKKTTVVVSGVLTEDDKGNLTLALDGAESKQAK